VPTVPRPFLSFLHSRSSSSFQSRWKIGRFAILFRRIFFLILFFFPLFLIIPTSLATRLELCSQGPNSVCRLRKVLLVDPPPGSILELYMSFLLSGDSSLLSCGLHCYLNEFCSEVILSPPPFLEYTHFLYFSPRAAG